MKILYCLAGTFNSGGMERIVIKKANWLVNNGFEVIIVTTEQQGRPSFFHIENKIKRVDLDINYSENTYNGSIYAKYKTRRDKIHLHRQRLTKLLEQTKPDITISTYGNEVNFLYKINDGSKKIVEIHFSRWFRQQCKQPDIIYKLINKYLTFKDKRLVRHYDAFVCLTNEDKGYWGNMSNIHVIPNFIESDLDCHNMLTNKQIISVGRLNYQKGYDRLIRAWQIVHKAHADWELKIFGGGELKDELLKLISDLNLNDSVRIYAPVKDIYSEYLKSSIYVLSSRYEGLPMVLLEAMKYGLPIVSFTCKCGPRDLIENGVNGLLIPEGDIKQLADGIIHLIENSEQRIEMGRQAHISSLQYDELVIMQKWESLFKSIL